jgi:N-methylhydantoinase B
LVSPTGTRDRLPGKVTIQVEAGDRLVVRTPGGGGWGAE